jgi:phosphonate transport system substrate-binding protein
MATPPVFYVGMSKACFRDVNRNDATAAYRVFLERSGLRFGDVYKAEPEVFEDAPAFEAAIRQTPMRMAVIEAWQFLEMDIRRTMRPFFAVMENGKVGRKYLVLTRRSGGLRTLADLRGKAILELEVASANVGRAWLDTRLLSERLGTQRTFFERVEVVGKPTAAVLPVFFGKKPACVVDEPSFEVMTELNPQVGQALQAVAVSESFADVVVCLREDGWATEKSKSNTVEALSELHLNPVGQQICTLFKIDRMVPFQETQLDTIRSLRTTYESLRKESTP